MTEEVRKYAEKRIIESNIRMVPGHYPEFDSKEQVDRFMEMSTKMSEVALKSHEEFRAKLFDLTDVDISEYQELLDRLKRNKEKVPLEILLTDHRKAYDQFKEMLQDMTKHILQDIVFTGLEIEQSQADQRYIEINTAIRESGIMEKISHSVFRQYSADQVLEYAGQLRKIVHKVAKGCEENAS